MIVGESAHEYVARTIGMANYVRYHKVEITDDEICRCIPTGLLTMLNFVRGSFTPRDKHSLDKL